MAIAVETILTCVRTYLKQLGQEMVVLANAYAEVFAIDELKQQLTDFQKAHQEATRRLENPTLSIATLGTTSSGKSTIVNALIGRRIAPIEAGEMSGGVLKLAYAKQSRLVIEATQGASWETGEWTGLCDRDIYDRIQSVMLAYHDLRRRQQDCIAPQITVYGPLLPACDRALLNLPQVSVSKLSIYRA